MNALHQACLAAADRQGDSFKTLALVINSEAGSAACSIGCTCPACAGYVMGAMGHALFSQLGQITGVERIVTGEARH